MRPIGARPLRSLSVLAVMLTAGPTAAAQSFPLTRADLADSAALFHTMPRLAEQVLGSYRSADRWTFLDNVFRLQMVAGRYADAGRTLAALQVQPTAPGAAATQVRARNVRYGIYVRARVRAAEGRPFPQSFAQEFRAALARLDDRTAGLVVRAFGIGPSSLQDNLGRLIAAQIEHATISTADALALLRAYQVAEAARDVAPLVAPLFTEDDERRYIIERNIAVRRPKGAVVCAMVVRPRQVRTPLPALLEFTIYADSGANFSESRRTASNGYVAVTGYTRGKMCSPGKPVPYRYDGVDAAAVIHWIARQPWSDGRVGMYEGSYEGFTQWAAAKHMPKALKAIMTGASNGPGIDTPMDGNVFWNFVYPWPFYTTDNKTLDNSTYYDAARWRRLNHDWYVSGRAYRDLDRIDGTANPVFDEWLTHPAYDAYWQALIPYQKDFGRINIAVLQTAGYYYGGPGAAVYYFTEHYKYNPRAEHYLVIGPYDHFQGQRGVVDALGDTAKVLAGYEIDPKARIDIVADLRYPWFDYVFKHGPKPALLEDKVNYEVTGANVWKHAPSIAAMSNHRLRLYLSAARTGGAYALSRQRPAREASVPLTVDLADRSDVDRNVPGGGVADTALDTWNGLEFVSEPLTVATEVSGLFSGRLEFITNKRDFDLNVALFELTPEGTYIELAPYWVRASHVGDLTHRRLLTPGKRQHLDFRSVRLMSRLVQRGSRLVAVLSVIKEPGRQINYGTGRDVSDETIALAKVPLTIDWFADSFIDIPVRR